MKKFLFAFVFALNLFAVTVSDNSPAVKKEEVAAEVAPQESQTLRTKNPLGFYIGANTDPFPAEWGMNIAYNVSDFSRFHAGLGMRTKKDETVLFGWGMNVFVPTWSTSPTFGISYAGTVGDSSVLRIKDHLYISAGIDLVREDGIQVGFGFNHSITDSALRAQPYLQLGHFFSP